MEIHMKDIAFACDHHTLTRKIAQVLHRPPFASLTIIPPNFDIRLFRHHTRDGHCGSGALTLPEAVGDAFMRSYGEEEGPWIEFHVMGRRVRFFKSWNTPKPDIVEKITRLEYKDPRALEEKERRARELEEALVPVNTIQFGWECRDKVFSIEWEHHATPAGEDWGEEGPGCINVYFSDENRELRVKLFLDQDPLDPFPTPVIYDDEEQDFSVPSVEIAARFALIQNIHAYTTPEGEHAVFLFLATPPHFELARPWEPKRKRLTHLPFHEHDRVVPYTSLHLRLVLSSSTHLDTFRRLTVVADLHNRMSGRVIPTARRELFSIWKIKQLYELWLRKVPWAVAFQIEGLVRALVVDMNEMIRLMPRVRRMSNECGASFTAEFLVVFRNRVRVWWQPDVAGSAETRLKDLDECWTEALRMHELSKRAPLVTREDSNLFDCLHVTITPTSIALEGPFPEQSNRVIRTYPKEKHECFLRVCFLDEDRLHYRFDREVDGKGFLEERVGKVLHNGLEIAGRRFKFLAYSQSALKEHAVWFVKPFSYEDKHSTTHSIDAASIITSLGTFDDKTRFCPARYAARLSQAFTATDAAEVEVEEVLLGDDVEITTLEGTKYCFTDGVGQISLELAEDIWTRLRGSRKHARRSRGHPRAFQIRYAGSKGMLAVNYKLRGTVISLRPSMIKFDAPAQNVIEIARAFDRPTFYFLNRPLIMLLEGLGVPYDVFERYQDAAIADVQHARQDVRGAAGLMERFGLGSSFQMASVLGSLARLGIECISSDEFYGRVLEFAVHHILREIKNRARIPVPEAWTLVGIIDEHDQLRAGEIYACVKPLHSNHYIFLEGPVLVSRSPTIHPGDVQIARAIGRPPLHSAFASEPLPNTVVFAKCGTRPLPSCLGGGDLDGDLYNLIPLDEYFRPKMLYTPATYAPAPKKILDRPSTVDDVADFVVEYINGDALGIIALNWLVIADQSTVGPYGIFHPDCLSLSQLHSDAVDFQKSGHPVSLDRIPRPPLRTKACPDWNAPETVNIDQSPKYYPSRRAIGRLFRRVDLRDIKPLQEQERQVPRLRRAHSVAPEEIVDALADAAVSEASDDPILSTIENRVLEFITDVTPSPEEAEDVTQLYARYVVELQSICQTHVLAHRRQTMLTEEEAVVGTIIEKTSQPRKRRELMGRLRDRMALAVRNVRAELDPEDEELRDGLRRAWIAWKLALREEKAFGAKSFGWIALGSMFEIIREIEEVAKEDLRRRGY
ncbi:RNA dependent RNA polymerase-domain-containing protein [Vararia minispora EC-137]|uniref:RNA dependent RNA polymerase-domain-containing protein n=1 Tax=Vararia minispora EC-137 TaxID=1314806 RepID=A0ACB8QNB7_9AGAM|nr:RNA dependent RNA polymerase-domain-containing protein [Vararia minispora EC-137]